MPRITRPGRSRQKSCTACAAGKRQCNRQTPHCGRCLARGIPCTYIHGTPRVVQARARSPVSSDDTPASFESLDRSIPDLSDEFLSIAEASEPWFSGYEADEDFFSWMSLSPSLLGFPQLSPMEETPDIRRIDKWSKEQSLRCIKEFSRMFAKHRCTPFIHARLYEAELPDAMADAFTVSAAYHAKSPETQDLVFRILEKKSSQLAYKDYQQESIAELLAAVQALVLFHTIQLFDGDIRQRSIAERDGEQFMRMVEQLRVRAIELGPASTWQAWIFGESLRRTVILAYFMMDIFQTLKQGYCSNVPTLSVLPFTAGENLWEATTDASWQKKVSNADSTMVLYGDFASSFKRGRLRGKLSPFERFLLRPCAGEEYREIIELQTPDNVEMNY
ncbi:hypothetical protein N7470_004845 [Penicillium chermesinum]|nr:hypothetical protein N7470_004845 [Penicillium chermesinum]